MFESFKGMAAMAGLMKDLPRIKAKVEQVKDRLGEKTVTAESGGGAVRVVINGHLHIQSLKVDPAILAGVLSSAGAQDHAMAEDLIAAAVNAGLTKAREMAAREFAEAADELGLPIPPGALGGFLAS